MRDRGYPIEDFEDRAALVSVDHPLVVERYRRAHAIAVANGDGGADTEDLRIAMQDFRALFVELVETDPVDAVVTLRAGTQGPAHLRPVSRARPRPSGTRGVCHLAVSHELTTSPPKPAGQAARRCRARSASRSRRS